MLAVMEIAFFYVERGSGDDLLAELMVKSIRKTMPSVRICQMTDKTTAGLDVDSVLRLAPEGGLMHFRTTHMVQYPAAGDVLYVDTDIIFKEDVSAVFDADFDVALVPRTQPLTIKESSIFGPEEDASKRMPFNQGVIFSKSRDIWKDVLAASEKWRDMWFSDQLAFGEIYKNYNVLKLDPRYNFTPQHCLEDVRDKAILHYKGNKRKLWMVQWNRTCPLSLSTLNYMIYENP